MGIFSYGFFCLEKFSLQAIDGNRENADFEKNDKEET